MSAMLHAFVSILTRAMLARVQGMALGFAGSSYLGWRCCNKAVFLKLLQQSRQLELS